jgi:ectoine hydroxylase-related dioxygenase (phytanoyl-CoA dioxygenase family)
MTLGKDRTLTSSAVSSGLRSYLRFAHQSAQAAGRRVVYEVAKRRRSAGSPDAPTLTETEADTLRTLRRQGYAVVPNAFPASSLSQLKDEMYASFAAGRIELVGIDATLGEDEVTAAIERHCADDDMLASIANCAYVPDIMLDCPSASRYIFSDTVLNLADAYYGCAGAVSHCSLYKSYVNDLPVAGFQHVHSDNQSACFLKFFLYLNDVDVEGGPFAYVAGSHRSKPLGWRREYKWTLQDMEAIYGRDAIRYVGARVGDLIVADTTGFHCGFKPISAARHILMINTGVHRIDRDGLPSEPKLTARQFESLTPRQRIAADFTTIVPDSS